jgi:hypothetical protein
MGTLRTRAGPLSTPVPRWFPYTLVLAGCAAVPAPAAESAAANARRRRRRRPAPAASAQCDALRAESRSTVAYTFGRRSAAPSPVLAALDWCAPTPGGGAWALHVDALAVERDPDTRAGVLRGTFSLVHATPDGTRAAAHPWSEGTTGPEGNLVCAT